MPDAAKEPETTIRLNAHLTQISIPYENRNTTGLIETNVFPPSPKCFVPTTIHFPQLRTYHSKSVELD